jgi:hypothetical protein
MSLKPMELDGILRFVGESDEEDNSRASQLRVASGLNEKYAVDRDRYATWKPLIVSQMMARGKLAGPTYFDVVDALLAAAPANVRDAHRSTGRRSRDG